MRYKLYADKHQNPIIVADGGTIQINIPNRDYVLIDEDEVKQILGEKYQPLVEQLAKKDNSSIEETKNATE